ncbi:hypothetical protein QBC38DRAFT_45987 [Podospora fimiseda]|uniref:Uncharacterized protein n=1 Tax=Podospora fimiseda TaxID=252190 RepID=A0AAN7GXL1_9PEZI|nr:hypothetical protein QBC38DRAFT_45987 [Podospora fimiseda]
MVMICLLIRPPRRSTMGRLLFSCRSLAIDSCINFPHLVFVMHDLMNIPSSASHIPFLAYNMDVASYKVRGRVVKGFLGHGPNSIYRRRGTMSQSSVKRSRVTSTSRKKDQVGIGQGAFLCSACQCQPRKKYKKVCSSEKRYEYGNCVVSAMEQLVCNRLQAMAWSKKRGLCGNSFPPKYPRIAGKCSQELQTPLVCGGHGTFLFPHSQPSTMHRGGKELVADASQVQQPAGDSETQEMIGLVSFFFPSSTLAHVKTPYPIFLRKAKFIPYIHQQLQTSTHRYLF